MKLHEYENYDAYVEAQTLLNKHKLDFNFVQAETLDAIAAKLTEKIGTINNGLCHGTRNGFEQKHLRERLNADIIGTEISDTATQFPNTIQWDFHEVKDEWLGSIDFVYSNAIDHSFDPVMCLDRWFSCLRVGGYLILHWTTWNMAVGANKRNMRIHGADYLVWVKRTA